MFGNDTKRSRAARHFFQALGTTTILASGLIAPAFAQIAAPPPVRANLDGNGVDLFLGTLNVSGPILSVGDNDGMRYQRIYRGGGWSDNMIAAINITASTATVTFDGASDSFTVSGSIFTPTEASGGNYPLASG